ncbi:MAG: RluA family pseudouridine synthase [Leptonema sp. (in: bacteria)]
MVLDIHYEDNHILVVKKPIGISTQPDRKNSQNLLEELKNHLKKTKNKENPYVALIHRLDRNTGGIMLFAKTSKAAYRLSNQFKNNQVKKKYLALTKNIPNLGEKGIMQNYLIKIESKRMAKLSTKENPKAKFSKLKYEMIEKIVYLDQTYYKFLVSPETGRFHQIRVQFSIHNAPLLGDRKYGNDKTTPYPALWAYEISFIHPTLKKEMTFQIAPPKNWPFFITTSDIFES